MATVKWRLQRHQRPGEIHPDVLYLLEEIKARANMRDWAIRQARKNGLRIRYLSGRAYCKGSDFIAFVDRTATDSR